LLREALFARRALRILFLFASFIYNTMKVKCKSAKWKAEAKLDIHQVRHLFSIQNSTRKKLLLAKYPARTDRYVTIEKALFNYATCNIRDHECYCRKYSNRSYFLISYFFTIIHPYEWNLGILHCDTVPAQNTDNTPTLELPFPSYFIHATLNERAFDLIFF